MDDLGIFRAGDKVPANWITVKPTNEGPFKAGEWTFGCDTEASYSDGWLRLHALEPGNNILVLDGAQYASLHFNFDIRLFDADGKQIGQAVYADGKHIPIA